MARNNRRGQQFSFGRGPLQASRATTGVTQFPTQLSDDIESDLRLIDTSSERLRDKFEAKEHEIIQLRKVVSELQEELLQTRQRATAEIAKHEKEVIELRQRINELRNHQGNETTSTENEANEGQILQVGRETYSIGKSVLNSCLIA